MNTVAIAKELTSMGNDSVSNMFLAGNYYLKIDDLSDANSSDFEVTLTVHIEYGQEYTAENVPGISVIIPPIFKYYASDSLNSNAELNSQLFLDIYEKIKKLDTRGLFDYTYSVDKDREISDPLDPVSYLDANHVMNKVTICQLDTSNNSRIYIANNVRN